MPMFETLIGKEELRERIKTLGFEVRSFYEGKVTSNEPLIVLGILRGSFIFLADVIRELHLPLQVDFVEASSYGSGTVSSGEVEILRDFRVSIQGKHVLVVEDIVDTGTTVHFLQRHLNTHDPKSIKVCSLLFKPSRLKKPVHPDFCGFTIEDHFVVGYGLDLDNRYREIPEIVKFEEERRPY